MMSPAGWLSASASTSAGTGSSATSRMASRLARRPGPAAACSPSSSTADPASVWSADPACASSAGSRELGSGVVPGGLVIVFLVVPFGAARRGGVLVAGRGGPAHVELAQRRQLVHGDPAFPVELQHGK